VESVQCRYLTGADLLARTAVLGAALWLSLTATAAATTATPAQPGWTAWQHIPGVVDVAGPRSDGAIVVAAADGLLRVDPVSGRAEPFAAGLTGYRGPGSGEPYIALSPGLPVASGGCRFERDDVFALQLKPAGGVLRIDAAGEAREFASVDGVESLNGIAFDGTGRFGNRLLVTGPSHGLTVVAAIDCTGQVTHITDAAPVLEGGLAVAPSGFGAFEGDLIAPDELSGNIYAISPDGSSTTLVHSGLPTGGDIGVEGVGFVPPGFSLGGAAYFADRSVPGNPHPGTDSLLRIDSRRLVQAGVREGDLLAASEGGAALIAVRCQPDCVVTRVSSGDGAHGEGHVLVLAAAPGHPGQLLPEASDLGRAALIQRWLLWGGGAAVGVLALSALGFLLVRRRRRRRM
jgi:hypothetical protein